MQNCKSPVFFLYQDYGTTPWAVQLVDCSDIDHILQQLLHFFMEMRRYPLVSLLEGFRIHQVDLMSDDVCFPHFQFLH